jgi:4-hydroxy-tetrahydrodipicolinate synthase
MTDARPARFGSVVTAMVTPFGPTGSLDLDAAVTLARWLVEHGSDGLVLSGTTGEGPVLADQERIDLWRAVAGAVTVPVIAGSGSNDTAHSVELTRAAAATGVAGVLVVTPYYNRPSQVGIFEHFRAVAGATDLPVMLYDIPARTGRRIAADTLLRLATEVANVVAVKDAATDVPGSARTVATAPAGFELYCGEDNLTLALLSVGAVGVVSVASHWAGPMMAEMITSFGSGDVVQARRLNQRLIESFDFESTEQFPNPLPAKAACRALGLDVGQCRLPMGTAPPELDGFARLVLGRLGVRVPVGGPVG